MNVEQDFNWYSNTIYEYFDNVQNSKLSFHLESGLSKNETGILNYTNTRLSVKIKDNRTNNKVEIELGFDDVHLLNTILGSISKNTGKPPIPINSYTKNKQRQLLVYEPAPGLYNISITDNSTIAKTIVVAFKKLTLASINEVISQVKSNWVTSSINSHSIVTTQSILARLEIIDRHITESTAITIRDNTKKHNTLAYVGPTSDTYESTYELNQVTSTNANIAPVTEFLSDDTVLFEPEDDTPVFDVEQPSVLDSIETPNLNFLLDDNVLSHVSLTAAGETGTTDYTKKSKQVITPRPFINNFIEWDIDNLYQWVTGFVYCDQNSDPLTLTPLDLILTKSIGKHKYDFITNHPKHWELEYSILDTIKGAMKSYVETGSTPPIQSCYIDSVPFDKNSDIDLWNFTVDITVLMNVFKIFLANVNRLNIKSDESLEKTFNVKIAYIFLDSINSIFLSKIKPEDHEMLGSDAINVYTQMSDRGSFDSLINTYSLISMGGKIQLNISMFKACMDKFLESQLNIAKMNIEELNNNINSVDDIREKLNIVIQKPKKTKSPQIKLFCKYLKENNLDDSKYKDCYELLELDIADESDSSIIKVYGILRMNPNITKMIQLENYIESQAESTVVPEPTKKSEPQSFDVWDIDDSDESLFNLED